MSGSKKDSMDDYLSDFIGKMVRVITPSSHYRGECAGMDAKTNNILLKKVVKKNDLGWVDISDHMLVMGSSIEAIYVEKSFPFDSNESLILSVEMGELKANEPESIDFEVCE
ncbi:hypothetical protein [Methanolobus sp.]|uniref:hypothetical protein n=1 Tax=Methanolobus sp. TaxID=1874737 RepID=UPI0025E449A3|nr:hypothetical protein [Methanolobus sp.]